jgi:ubiquitin-protein ligase
MNSSETSFNQGLFFALLVPFIAWVYWSARVGPVAPPPAVDAALSADELRRRRLQRLESAAASSTANRDDDAEQPRSDDDAAASDDDLRRQRVERLAKVAPTAKPVPSPAAVVNVVKRDASPAPPPAVADDDLRRQRVERLAAVSSTPERVKPKPAVVAVTPTPAASPAPTPSAPVPASPAAVCDHVLRSIFRVGRRGNGTLQPLTAGEAERATRPPLYGLLSVDDVDELIRAASARTLASASFKGTRAAFEAEFRQGIAVLGELYERAALKSDVNAGERGVVVDACIAQLLGEIQERFDSESEAFGFSLLPTSAEVAAGASVPLALLPALEQLSEPQQWQQRCRALVWRYQVTVTRCMQAVSPFDGLSLAAMVTNQFCELAAHVEAIRGILGAALQQRVAARARGAAVPHDALSAALAVSALYLGDETPRSVQAFLLPLRPNVQFFMAIPDFPPDPQARFMTPVHAAVDEHTALLRRATSAHAEALGRLVRLLLKDRAVSATAVLFLRDLVLQGTPRAAINALAASHNSKQFEAIFAALPDAALCGAMNNVCMVALDLFKSRFGQTVTIDWRRALLLPRGFARTMAKPLAAAARDAIEAQLDAAAAAHDAADAGDTAEAAERAYQRRDERRGQLLVDSSLATAFARDSEFFFLAQHAVHVALPSTFRVIELLLTLQNRMLESGRPYQVAAAPLEHFHRYVAVALNVGYVGCAVQLFTFTCARLLDLLGAGAAHVDANVDAPLPADAAHVLGMLPEWLVTDGFVLLSFCARLDALSAHGGGGGGAPLQQGDLRAAVQLGSLLLLWQPTLVRTQARGHIVSALRQMLALAREHEKSSRALPSGRRCAEAFALSARESRLLVLGLVELFVRAGAVEGLDVDVEDFDLTAVRGDVANLLLDLYASAEMKIDSGAQLQALDDALLRAAFVKDLFEYAEHCVEDALHRMSDVSDAGDRQFVEHQRRAAAGFGSLGATMLRLLVHVVARQRAAARTQPLVSSEMAARCLAALLARLIDTAERGGEWVPKHGARDVVLDIALLVCDLARLDLRRFADVWCECDDADLLPRLCALMTTAELAVSSVVGGLRHVATAVGASRAQLAAARADAAAVRARVDALLAGATCDAAAFTAAMSELVIAVTDGDAAAPDLLEQHHYRALALKSSCVGRKQLRLMSELERLAESLPLSPDAAIFVCVDGARIDTWRVLISGPRGTPYAFGLFEFHLFFPDDYPQVAPLMILETTGSGSVRFNPNLYNNGKVCLSILGTWNAGDAVSRWQPDVSSAMQVLVSVQSMILVAEPYFNEPSYESQRGTRAGMRASHDYNARLHLHTLRHAIVAQLRAPPRGFEATVAQYARLAAPLLRTQARAWLDEARGTPLEAPLQREVDALDRELDRLLQPLR